MHAGLLTPRDPSVLARHDVSALACPTAKPGMTRSTRSGRDSSALRWSVATAWLIRRNAQRRRGRWRDLNARASLVYRRGREGRVGVVAAGWRYSAAGGGEDAWLRRDHGQDVAEEEEEYDHGRLRVSDGSKRREFASAFNFVLLGLGLGQSCYWGRLDTANLETCAPVKLRQPVHKRASARHTAGGRPIRSAETEGLRLASRTHRQTHTSA